MILESNLLFPNHLADKVSIVSHPQGDSKLTGHQIGCSEGVPRLLPQCRLQCGLADPFVRSHSWVTESAGEEAHICIPKCDHCRERSDLERYGSSNILE